LRAARAADPRFFPAHFTYMKLMRFTGDMERLRREYVGSTADTTPSSRCLSAVAAAPWGYEKWTVSPLLELEARYGSSDCATVYIAYRGEFSPSESTWVAGLLEYNREAVTRMPELWELWLAYAQALDRTGHRSDALAALDDGLRRSPSTTARVHLQMYRYHLHLARGDTTMANAIWKALALAVARDARQAVQWAFVSGMPRESLNTESRLQEAVHLARSARAWSPEWMIMAQHGQYLLDDSGDPAAALTAWNRAVVIADSFRRPALQLLAHVRRGRALAKLGHLADAERDLRRAIELGTPIGEPYWLAEAYHNLAHVYEGANRLVEASQAADSFVALTRPLRYAEIRMMSLHDVGIIRWKAGWHAAANAAFREMVQVVDELGRQYYWAGEYFERIGDLENAIRYYRKGVASSETPIALDLAGIVRVFEALGLADSAEAAARAHDRLRATGLHDLPILPTVLARRGEVQEAAAIWREWAEQRIGQGAKQAAAQTLLHLADLLLDNGQPREARVEAERAESLAASLNLTDELIRAWRVEGLARVRMGHQAEGLSRLRAAARMARSHPTTDGILTTQLALAEGLAAVRREREAVAAFDRAAQAVEQVTDRLSQDLDRARYRDRHLAPFDGASRLLLESAPSITRVRDVLAWSARRKAAALALSASPLRSSARPATPLTLAQVQGRLRPRQALLDYIVLDSTVAVLVVTRGAAQLVRLPTGMETVRPLIEQLRRPLVTRYAGRVDLARAPFDLRLARTLYRALLAPLESLLVGTERLIIVPDGPLHYVAFDALVATGPPSVRLASARPESLYWRTGYLIDRFEITYLPSAQFLSRPASDLNDMGLLAVTRQAPGGSREVATLASAWPRDRLTVLTEGEATETAARAASVSASVVHFAVHAQADDRDPLASHLRLGADEENDGYFHLAEIADARRPARLVVLSACETQSGRLFNGEGLMGLARAFLASGAGAVVATQWPVGPAAADLMGEFYRRLASGAQPAAALRAAKLALRRDPTTAHPFYWAGFVLVTGR
jgi:CHAT domain-containing protein